MHDLRCYTPLDSLFPGEIWSKTSLTSLSDLDHQIRVGVEGSHRLKRAELLAEEKINLEVQSVRCRGGLTSQQRIIQRGQTYESKEMTARTRG